MLTDTSLSTKTLGETEPGELVQTYVNTVSGYGIVLRQDGPNTTIGILHPVADMASYPFYLTGKASRLCLSYGRDWYMKPVIDPLARVGDNARRYWAGVLHLHRKAWTVNFVTSDRSFGEDISFNLSTNEVSSIPNDTFQVHKWGIWRSKDDYTSGKDELVIVQSVDADDVPR